MSLVPAVCVMSWTDVLQYWEEQISSISAEPKLPHTAAIFFETNTPLLDIKEI